MSEPVWIEIAHRRVGEMRLDEADVIHFAGLPGFPDARRFALCRHDQDGPLSWLACLDDVDLAFVVTDPRQFFPDYAPRIPDRYRRLLSSEADAELELLAIVNLSGGAPRLNLAAPLVVDARTRKGAQVLLEDGKHEIARALPTPAAKPGPPPRPQAPPQMESKPQR